VLAFFTDMSTHVASYQARERRRQAMA
jgi:hypothetical protein